MFVASTPAAPDATDEVGGSRVDITVQATMPRQRNRRERQDESIRDRIWAASFRV
jgi:hypothetical protein